MCRHKFSDWWRRNRGVAAVVSFIILFLLVAVVISTIYGTKAGKDFGELLQKYGMVAAIVAGAVWGLYQFEETRYRWPRLVGKQTTEFIPFDDEHVVCRVWVDLENKGNTQVVLTKGKVTVRQILPQDDVEKETDSGTLRLKRLDGRWLWPCGVSLVLDQPDQFDIHIEPGEQDRVAFDLLIPRYWELAEVCTDLENRDEKQHGWKTITLHAVPTKFDFPCCTKKGDVDETATATEA